MRVVLGALVVSISLVAGCTDGGGGQSAAVSSEEKVLWSQDDIDAERQSCIDGNTGAFGSKAPTWCLCIIETASKRWSHEDFIKTPIEKFEVLGNFQVK